MDLDLIVERKLLAPGRFPHYTPFVYRNELEKFLDRLNQACFLGLVLDFDGTIRSLDDDLYGLDSKVIERIIFLAQSGLNVGVATGRGCSVTKILRNYIPDNLWNDILMGYGNGSIILPLSEEISGLPQNKDLAFLESELRKTKSLADRFEIILREYSIALKSLGDTSPIKVPEELEQVINSAQLNNKLRILETGFTIDIVLHHVSKKTVKTELINACGKKDGYVLSIGDQGHPGGNDYDLLKEDFGLSVDLVSPDPSGCWNLAPHGVTGPRACLGYLKALIEKNNGFVFDLDRIKNWWDNIKQYPLF
jgi:hydroxymethylpyrimidine pyrophosphatase-like HAD family hydrolase